MADFSTPALFANGLPTLNQSLIDKQFGNKRTNELTANNSDIRDQLYNAGWGQKSDAVRVLTGAGNYGIVSSPEGMGGMGFKTTSGQNATDQSFINAAKAAGIDPSLYYRQQQVGMGGKQNVLDKTKLYNALQDAGKGIYSVTNAVEGAKRGDQALHATVSYKADGNGNLVPINNEQTGQPAIQYFNATRYAKDPGIMGCLAPFLMLAPAVGGILGGAGGLLGSSAAAGPGTLGLGAGAGLSTGTMAGEMLGAGVTGAGLAPVLGSTATLGASSLAALNGADTGFLSQAKSALDTAKKVKGLYDAGQSLFGGDQTCTGGTSCSGAGGGFTGFLNGTPTFLNTRRPYGKSAGLKTVNDEAEKNVESLSNETPETVEQPAPQQTMRSGGLAFSEAGSVPGNSSATTTINTGDLTGAIKDWDQAFCHKNLYPKFVKCTKPNFLFAGKSMESHKLKPIRQTKINPLAAGGLPHKYAAAAPKGHKPEFITGMTGYYACGKGTGQSDDIPAMLHDGDYVMDAETVSALGDGSSKAGREVLEGFREKIPHMKEGGGNPVPAKIADGEYVFPAAFVTALGGGDNKRGAEILDGLRTKLRAHKRGAPLDKIPPKAKDPIEYIKTGSKKHG